MNKIGKEPEQKTWLKARNWQGKYLNKTPGNTSAYYGIVEVAIRTHGDGARRAKKIQLG